MISKDAAEVQKLSDASGYGPGSQLLKTDDSWMIVEGHTGSQAAVVVARVFGCEGRSCVATRDFDGTVAA